jgi:polyphosphate:AMP phosphotransferase
MLEQVDLSLSMSKEEYNRLLEPLGHRLGELQRHCREEGIPVIAVFEGWDASGKDGSVNRLMRLIDPRGFKVYATGAPREDELLRPFLWRYAIRTPPRGFMSVFIRSWYGRVLVERVEGIAEEEIWKQAYEDILDFERQLIDDGFVVAKFWLHISKKEQKKRLKKMAEDPMESWKVKQENWNNNTKYREYTEAVEEMLQKTSVPYAPWTIVESECKFFGRLKIYETLARAMDEALKRHERKKAVAPQYGNPVDPSQYKTLVLKSESFLKRYDLTRSVPEDDYRKSLNRLQKKARQVHHRMFLDGKAAALVFEGWDAAGKGGAIKRLLAPLDTRRLEVVTTPAPSLREQSHHYLWRFWRDVPKQGNLTIFDRSWYGRVLVERVEGFCTTEEWRRAYNEINEFERMLANHGIAVIKFWLHIDKEEQLRRFESRKNTPHKAWKLTEEDWRNRERWEDYELAVAEMIQRTSTTYSPWTVVESNSKHYARLKVIETFIKSLTPHLEVMETRIKEPKGKEKQR